jgi:hypothetical protein
MQVRTKTHAASHEIRSTLARGEMERLALWIMDSAPANCSAIHNPAVKSPDAFQHSRVHHGKMKIAAACHAPGKIASHNACVNTCDPSALTRDAIKPAESRRVQHKSTRHDRARYCHNCTVLRKAKRNGQSVPEAAGALM